MIIEDCDCDINCGWNKKPPVNVFSGELTKEFIAVVGLPHLNIEHLSNTSSFRCVWKCQKRHVWESTLSNRTLGNGCPYCAGKKPVKGENDFETLQPVLAQDWDYDKNTTLPSEYTVGSGFRAYWKCSFEHSWSTQINDRVFYQTGCPFCSKRKLLLGFNDLATTHPELVKQWNYDLNTSVSPQAITSGYKKNVWWKHFHEETQNWHSWSSSVFTRAKDGSGCLYCVNDKVLTGFNDLETKYPELAKEWDPILNKKSAAETITGSHSNAWWKCSKGHSWNASIKGRCRGNGCAQCTLSNTSKIEQRFYTVLKKYLKNINLNHLQRITLSDGKKIQVDIFGTYNNRKIAIEYDGKYYHHKNVQRDVDKTQKLLTDGWIVVRIRENDLCLLPLQHPLLIQTNFDYTIDMNKVEKQVVEITIQVENATQAVLSV